MENMNKQQILTKYFKHYKDIDITDLEGLSYEENVYFFDTENGPIFPDEIVDKYDLKNVEYDQLDVFKDVTKDGLLYKMHKNRQITTEIYCWQFGCNTTNNVYWGNSIQEFLDFIETINEYKVQAGYEINPFDIYVHNLAWDIEFFKYFFKDNKYYQIPATQDRKERSANQKLQYAFEITETDGTVHNARIQLENKSHKIGRKKINYLSTLCFYDSAKITPMSLKTISEKMIKVDDKFIKNSDVYQYNIVRDPKSFVPNEIEAWYIYCDIYLLSQWYNQFVVPNYISQGIKCYTISQIAFDSILKKTYESYDRSLYARTGQDPTKVTDRQIYEDHFCLRYIEKVPKIKEYLRLSYKGGHTTASAKYREVASTNTETISGVSCDITSSYPGQMCLKPLPYGKPHYFKGKYKNKKWTDDVMLDYHFITIAFDGFTSKLKGNQFGLNVKLRGLTDEQKKHFNCSTNESATTNLYKGEFVGHNRIDVTDPQRSKLIEKYQQRKFIITVSAHEYEEWIQNFDFYCYTKNRSIKKGVEFIDYISFQSEIGHFKKGLDHFFKMKEDNDKPESEGGNIALKENAKLIINSFYGKHCSRRDRKMKFYDFDKDIITFYPETDLDHQCIEWEDQKMYAVHYGSAVTSYGRQQLRETCRKIGSDKFIYADTDSLKFEMDLDQFKKQITDNNVYVSFKTADKKLGTWDYEFSFDDFKAVAQKKYIYLKEGKNEYTCKCAGLPKEIRDQIIRKDQFSIGAEFIKKAKKKIPGGNLLMDISYKIQDFIKNEDL